MYCEFITIFVDFVYSIKSRKQNFNVYELEIAGDPRIYKSREIFFLVKPRKLKSTILYDFTLGVVRKH